MARKTYRSKRAALAAAHGSEIYSVKGPPRGWRISRGKKVRGKRGRAQRARARVRKTIRKTKRRRKTKKKTRRFMITIGNPNPSICGWPES